jgi:Trk-type K+ transport system membrane component
MRLFWHELRGQLRLYTRSKELAFFTFLLPLILFILLGSTYGDDTINGDRGCASAHILHSPDAGRAAAR